MKNTLSSVELYAYFFIWSTANVYCLVKLFQSQNEILKEDPYTPSTLIDLQPGWNFLDRHKDVSDIEWSSWKYFIQTSWIYLFFQFLISEFIRSYSVSLLKYWYILSSTIFIVLYMGTKQFLIISIQPILYTCILFCGGKKASIWIVSITLLISYNSLKYKYFFWNYLEHDNLYDEEVYLLLFCIAWTELRCISYSLDFIERNKKSYNETFSETMINLTSYVFYLPLLYSGPVLLYSDYENSFLVTEVNLKRKLKRFFWDFLLFWIYTLILDLSLHYIYFYAMQSDMKLIRKFPTLALCGGGLYMGLNFHMKYVIAYGTTTAFTRLDNMDPPPTPRCIARIHVYSLMWRYFDVGLYRFLVKYIHKPSSQVVSKYIKPATTMNKLVASLTTFMFIFIWHGTIKRIFIWSILNYFGITLEYFSKAFSQRPQYKHFKKCFLKTDAMETRFIALLCVPLLALSAISNFYLFAGTEVGDLFFESLSHPTLWTSLYVCTGLYCCCHVSIALENVGSRTDVK